MLGEWLSGLHRERFKVVRDERDAYMNLQEEYMSQMQDTTSAMTEAESERGRLLEGLRAEHAAARAAARDGLEQARALFREEGLPPEEATSLTLPALLARVRAVASERRLRGESLELELVGALTAGTEARAVEEESRSLAESLRAEAEGLSTRTSSAEARAYRAEEEAMRERRLRTTADAALEICQADLEAALVDAEQGQVNLGIMAGERRAALAKVAELGEQKRILIREVKAARSSLADASAVNRRLARAYESLDRSLRAAAAASLSTEALTSPNTTSAAASVGSSSSSSIRTAAAAVDEPPDDSYRSTAVETAPAVEGLHLAAAANPTAAAAARPAAAGRRHGDSAGLPFPGRLTRPSSPGGSSVGSSSAAGDAPAAATAAVVAVAAEWRQVRVASCATREKRRRNSSSADSFGEAGGGAGGRGRGGVESGGCGVGGGDIEGVRSVAATGGVQVRNLSTGDVDVVVPGGGARARAATEGDALLGSKKPQTSSIDSLSLKITQGFTSASWPWVGSGASGGGPKSSNSDANEPAITTTTTTTISTAPATTNNKSRRSSITDGSTSSATAIAGVSIPTVAAKNSISTSSNNMGNSICHHHHHHPVPSISLSDLEGADSELEIDGSGGGGGGHDAGDIADALITPAFSTSAGSRSHEGEVMAEVGRGGSGEEDEVGMAAAAAAATAAVVEERDGGHRRVSVGALLCRRCGGTVEGPLHSTCSCTVPQLQEGLGPEASAAPSATAGMLKLKGVFKTFNGRVEVARQMLDSAIRQNMSNNMGRPDPSLEPLVPSTGGTAKPVSVPSSTVPANTTFLASAAETEYETAAAATIAAAAVAPAVMVTLPEKDANCVGRSLEEEAETELCVEAENTTAIPRGFVENKEGEVRGVQTAPLFGVPLVASTAPLPTAAAAAGSLVDDGGPMCYDHSESAAVIEPAVVEAIAVAVGDGGDGIAEDGHDDEDGLVVSHEHGGGARVEDYHDEGASTMEDAVDEAGIGENGHGGDGVVEDDDHCEASIEDDDDIVAVRDNGHGEEAVRACDDIAIAAEGTATTKCETLAAGAGEAAVAPDNTLSIDKAFAAVPKEADAPGMGTATSDVETNSDTDSIGDFTGSADVNKVTIGTATCDTETDNDKEIPLAATVADAAAPVGGDDGSSDSCSVEEGVSEGRYGGEERR